MKKIEAGQILEARSFADYDCIFRVEVLHRTPKTAVVKYLNDESRCKVYVDRNGDEYILALGSFANSPIFYGKEVGEDFIALSND